MFSTLLLLASSAAPCTLPPVPEAALTRPVDGEFDTKLTEAGDDVAKLWEVYQWCGVQELKAEGKKVLAKIVEVDPDHEDARKALGHRRYDDQWFESYSALSKYRREEEKRRWEEHREVRFRDGWASEAELPYLRMGWVKDDSDQWISPSLAARLEAEAKYKAEKYEQRPEDGTWIPPAEFDKWREGLWKCGDEWLATDAANAYHAEIGRWWEYHGKFFVTLTTNTQERAVWAAWWADQAYGDMLRVFGVHPAQKPRLVVLNGIEQYNNFAAGDQVAQRPGTEIDGNSSVHYAYFADAWFDGRVNPPEFLGCGVCYWDPNDESLAPYGQHAIRHAAAQSYCEAIDPSWNTVSAAIEASAQVSSTDAFWAEKKIPRWLRYGAASYTERFFMDSSVDANSGDPWWARAWATENLRAKGGLRKMEQIFEFPITVNDPEGSAKLISEAGLLVSFMLDGDCKPVKDAHQAFKVALKSGEDTATAVAALQKALMDNEKALQKYAKL